MSRNQRIGLIVVALVVAVLAFVIASPDTDDDDEAGAPAAQTTPAETENTETEATETEAEPAPEPEPQVTRIQLRGGAVVGGPPEIKAQKGDTIQIVVRSDAVDEIHLHGYDIERSAAPGKPARFKLKTDLEGAFEIESHVAEDAGRDPLVARLTVEPR